MTARLHPGRVALLPFDPVHLAALAVQAPQRGEAARYRQSAGAAAALGPAYTAAEVDADGRVLRVLACAGLAESAPDYATAWASFGEGLRPAQWAALTAMIRAALDASGYARIDMVVRAGFAAAERFARHLGFVPDATIYAREGARQMFHEEPFHGEPARHGGAS